MLLAWTYLQRESFGLAGERFCTSLRRFAEARGKAGLFHATISWAYLTLIHERTAEGGQTFAAFVAANPDLLERGGAAVRSLYDEETLASERARRVFILPRQPRRQGSV